MPTAQDTQRLIDDAQGAVQTDINKVLSAAAQQVQLVIDKPGATSSKAVTTVENSPRIMGLTYGGIAIILVGLILLFFAGR